MRSRGRFAPTLVLLLTGAALGALEIGCSSESPPASGTGGSPATGGGHGTGTGGASTGSGGTSTGSGGASTTGAGGSVPGTGGTTTGPGGRSGGTGGATTGTTGGTSGTGTGGAGIAGHPGTGGAAGSTSTGTGGTGVAGHAGPCDIWVAPDGSDTNPGTEALPVATPQHGYDLLCPGVTGSANGAICSGTLTTMCLKAGTYKLGTRVEFKKTRMGTATRIITMRADPAATTKPVLDFSSQPRLGCGDSPVDKNIYGVDIGSDWTRVQGLEVSGANDTGILVQGSHDFVDNCVVHDAEDTGVLISSSSGFTGSGTYATITNTDSYHNHDERCEGANADGFGAKKGGGAGNVFDGCRSWDNADDGYDFYAWTDPVTVKNSWAFNMGATTAGAQSNGNGFKMGGNDVSAKHVMSNLFAFYNQGNGGHKADWGFTNNSNPASMTCTGCGAWNNTGGAFQGITHTGDVTAKATAAAAAAAKRNADGSLPDVTKL
ncbi:MAG: right-handed parallel beta-helix repeat-containing protein [Polyangia bacterium]